MTDKKQLEVLKKSVEEWNKWRKDNSIYRVDLTEADLHGVNLDGADLGVVNFSKANLRRASLVGANLAEADLGGATLVEATLDEADLRWADLSKADLKGAKFYGTNLNEADLSEANLKGAELYGTNLAEANLRGANLSKSELGKTVFGDIDLSETKGLDEVIHKFSSTVGTDALQRSKGKIPEKFLRGCGLSDWEIESAKLYQPGLSAQEVDNILYRVHDLRVGQAIQINPLFISYSHKDGAFVDEMEKHLDKKGIRFWRDIHDVTAGRLEKVVDRAMRLNPTVLLILSEASVQSDWVEHEARTARELEKELGRDVLCPVALDDAWKTCKWPERLREQIMEYHILDFSKWENGEEFGKVFGKLIDGLDLFYKEK
ncbi:MAG: pentapeptide repeat-containing protein [Anaerolineaceae bacterium]|nr:MAG: pentapeptide repeat-containing protein [Anaerolineaceae bacterium]